MPAPDAESPGEATDPSPPRPRVVEEVAQQPSRDAPALDLTDAVGVGVDVVGVSAFAEQLDQPGTRFAGVFTPGERRTAAGDPQRLAARWAAKEAVIKAWSSTYAGRPDPLPRDRVDLREIEVRTDAWGRPTIRLHGEIARGMAAYTVLVSLSHDPAADTATAYVVLQRR